MRLQIDAIYNAIKNGGKHPELGVEPTTKATLPTTKATLPTTKATLPTTKATLPTTLETSISNNELNIVSLGNGKFSFRLNNMKNKKISSISIIYKEIYEFKNIFNPQSGNTDDDFIYNLSKNYVEPGILFYFTTNNDNLIEITSNNFKLFDADIVLSSNNSIKMTEKQFLNNDLIDKDNSSLLGEKNELKFGKDIFLKYSSSVQATTKATTKATTSATLPTTKATTKATLPTTKARLPTTKATLPTTKATLPTTKATTKATNQVTNQATLPTTKATLPTTKATNKPQKTIFSLDNDNNILMNGNYLYFYGSGYSNLIANLYDNGRNNDWPSVKSNEIYGLTNLDRDNYQISFDSMDNLKINGNYVYKCNKGDCSAYGSGEYLWPYAKIVLESKPTNPTLNIDNSRTQPKMNIFLILGIAFFSIILILLILYFIKKRKNQLI